MRRSHDPKYRPILGGFALITRHRTVIMQPVSARNSLPTITCSLRGRIMRRTLLVLLAYCALAPAVTRAGDFQPDPRAVQRYGAAYRYPQAGWIVLHIEGEPYERGVQHGRLLAPEIAAHVRCFAATQNPKSPAEGWKQTRTLANALFLRPYDKEYLEQLKSFSTATAAPSPSC